MPFIPHTEKDTKDMLDTIGVKNIDALFDEVPRDLFDNKLASILSTMNEAAPVTQPVQCLDDVNAARELDIAFKAEG